MRSIYYARKGVEMPDDKEEDIIIAPDLYEEINFEQRCKEYKL
jgi:hypothetical protein